MKFIKSVVLNDGIKSYANEQILNNEDYKRYYAMGNVLYQNLVDEINNCEECYLHIDATDRPTYQIVNPSDELKIKLITANLF